MDTSHHLSNPVLEKIFNSIHEDQHENLSYEHILDTLFTSMENVIPFDRLGIALLVENNQKIRLKWVNSKIPTKWLTESYTVPVKDSGLEEILNTGKTVIINDLKSFFDQNHNGSALRLILKDGFRSHLTCPLLIDGKPIGLMFFSSIRPNVYASNHKDTCGEISEGISNLIHKSDEKKNVYHRLINELNGPLHVMQKTIELIDRNKLYQGLDAESEKAFYLLKNNCANMMNAIQSLLRDTEHGRLKQ